MQNKTQQVAEFNNAWKGRGSLAKLVAELQRQRESRVDFVADVRNFTVECEKGKVALVNRTNEAGEWLVDGRAVFNDSAAHQLAEKCDPGIPRKFFDALLDSRPHRLADLVNGLHGDGPDKRLIRCLDGQVRAWLSSSYRIIDNYDVAFTCLDEAQRKNAQVFEADLSDRHMRIKFTTQQVWDAIDVVQNSGPKGGWYAGAIGNRELIGKTVLGAKITGEMPGGPGTIHPVVTVSNSETGHGGFRVRLGILMAACYNVATLEDVVTQIHLGERQEEGIFTAETISAESKAIMMKAKDAVRAAFDPEKFKLIVATVRRAQSTTISQPTAAVENVIEVGGLNDEHKEALLEYFLRDYSQTQYGLAQAVSRLAQDTDDGDDAYELEALAGKIIKTPAFANV